MVSYADLTDEQQRAVDALDRNVTLTAGAGTGKTTTLTARYLWMLEDSLAAADPEMLDPDDPPLQPENIVTTTFTERAANELEESIRTEITDRLAELDPDAFDAWRTIADELEQGYIHTLHGFCARLLREHAFAVNAVDPGFETLDEDETAALIDDTVGAVLEEYETHDAMATLAQRFSRDQLRSVLTDLLGERPESIDWAKEWADATETEYIDFVESHLHPIDPDMAAAVLSDPAVVDAIETLTEIIEQPPDIDTGGRAWKRAVGVVELIELGYDDGQPTRAKQALLADLSQHLTTNEGDRYAGYSAAKSNWDDHPRKAAFDDAFETLVDRIAPEDNAVSVDLEIERRSFDLVSALAEVTLLAADEYEDRKTRQNVVDFGDLISYTVAFLESEHNESVRQELRDRFEYVMVDEFQDTDPRQWDLVKLLTADDPDEFDAENVFVVGDVKQSIYRFRNADVTQFRETAEILEAVADGDTQPAGHHHVGNETTADDDQLSTNFRTLPTVLESINELFDAIFESDGDPYEAEPQRLRPARDDPVGVGSVEYLAVPTEAELRATRFDHYPDFADAEPEHDSELEAMALAARLSQLLAEPAQVYPEADADDTTDPTAESTGDPTRDIEPSDIAILLRSRTHLKTYERALNDATVPYSVASGLGFYETTEITVLLNLFRALADPTDERALYATLRSPLFGLTDDTLAQLKQHGEPLWAALGESSHEELAEVYELLTRWRRQAGIAVDDDGADEEIDVDTEFRGSWPSYLTQIIEETGFFVNISVGERPQQAIANVEKFREQLRGFSEDDVRSLTTLVNRIERRLSRGGRESEADTTDEGVQILTIHDAKGMEFPFVVVPGIGRGFNDEASLNGQVEFEEINARHAVGMKAPQPNDPFEMADTMARNTLRDQRRAEERAEEKRVLYVACTRARDHLLLSGLHESAGETETPSVTDLKEATPDDASSWRDWVQAELLTDDVCEELQTSVRVERSYGDGSYTVSLPTPRVEREPETTVEDPAVELSETPPTPEITFRLSATDWAALQSDYGELALDTESRMLYVEEVDPESPDRRHGDESAKLQSGPERDTAEDESGQAVSDIKSRIFGEMVHQLCELRAPEDRWAEIMRQTLAAEDASVELTPDLQARVRKHARRGIEYIQQQATAADVEQRYDELYVTAEFDRGEIVGYIDHLLVTPSAYHIVDYKTGDVTEDELADDAAYYAKQMHAYAVALAQQDATRSVRISLVFTAIDKDWTTELAPTEIESLQEDIETTLLAEILEESR